MPHQSAAIPLVTRRRTESVEVVLAEDEPKVIVDPAIYAEAEAIRRAAAEPDLKRIVRKLVSALRLAPAPVRAHAR